MNNISLCRHVYNTITAIVLYVIIIATNNGCYSFSGGSVPPHLKTVSIATVLDNSNFGTPQYRELAMRTLIDKFRSDNSLSLIDRDGDARISSTITEIREEAINVKAGEVEREIYTIDAPMARSQTNRQQMTVSTKGKRAVTHVRKIARLLQGTLVACKLDTGRTHLIRVHLKALGTPIMGDYAPIAHYCTTSAFQNGGPAACGF